MHPATVNGIVGMIAMIRQALSTIEGMIAAEVGQNTGTRTQPESLDSKADELKYLTDKEEDAVAELFKMPTDDEE